MTAAAMQAPERSPLKRCSSAARKSSSLAAIGYAIESAGARLRKNALMPPPLRFMTRSYQADVRQWSKLVGQRGSFGSFASILPCPLSGPLSPTPDIASSDRDRVLVALSLRRGCCLLALDPRCRVPKNRVGLEARDRRCSAPIAYSKWRARRDSNSQPPDP